MQFDAFCRYRDMGPKRTITRLAAELKCRPQTLYNLSSRMKWAIRIAAYENHLSQIATEKIEKLHQRTAAMEAIAEYHITAMLARNAKRLDRKHEQDEEWIIAAATHAQIADLTARQARVGRGDASERTEIKGDATADLLSTLKEIGQRRKQSQELISPNDQQLHQG